MTKLSWEEIIVKKFLAARRPIVKRLQFIEHRVGDRRVVWLIQKWLAAGVLEEGKRIHSEEGTVQGGSISPLIANVYLHYVFDLWVQWWRSHAHRGEVIVTRYADDCAPRMLEECRT